jgi:HEAT repeat protein
MKTLLKTFLLIAVIFAPAAYAAAGDITTVLSGLSGPGQGLKNVGVVFRPDDRRISAQASVKSAAKTGFRFSWYSPDGRLYQTTIKLAFPTRGSQTVSASDSMDGPFAPGWWKVEITSGDTVGSIKFLVTDSEAAHVAAYGDRAAKIGVLEGISSDLPDHEDIIRLAASDKDPDVRAQAVMAAVGTGVVYGAEMVRSAATDGSEVVRAAAARTAYILPDPERDDMLAKLSDDTSTFVRQNTAKALGAAGTQNSARELGKLIADRDWLVRDAAFAALSAMESDAAVEALSKGLLSEDTAFRGKVLAVLIGKSGRYKTQALTAALKDTDKKIRLAALNALVKGGGEWPVDKALPMIDDPDETVAQTAFDVMSGAGLDGALDAGLVSRYAALRSRALGLCIKRGGPKLPGRLDTALKDAEPAIRRRAVDVLGGLGAAGVGGLVHALDDAEEDIRISAVSALAEIKAPAAEDAMTRSLKDGSAKVRRQAVVYFASIGGDVKYGVLEGVANDPSKSVRGEGLAALLADKDPRSSRALGAYYATGSAKDRRDIIEALSVRNDGFAHEALKEALKDGDSGIRLLAVKALGNLGYAPDVAGLALDDDKDVRVAALRALKSGHDTGDVAAIKTSLKYPDPGVRYAALEALADIPGAEAGRAISSALKDPAADVRDLAVRLVLAREDDGVLEGLIELLDAPGPKVVEGAVHSLVRLPVGAVDDRLVRAVKDGSKPVRKLALDVLVKRGSALLSDAVVLAVSSRDAKLRKAGLAATISLDDTGRRRAYLEAALSSDTDTRLAGVKGLTGVKGDGVEKALVDALSDTDSRIREAAVKVLAGSWLDSLMPRLAVLVADPDYKVARAAFDIGVKAGGQFDKTGMLTAAALGPHDDIAREAVDLMIENPGSGMLAVFKKYFEKGYKRTEILAAAGSVTGDDVTDFIGEVYGRTGSDDQMRSAAVKCLDGRGEAALPFLSEAIADSSRDIRLEAVRVVSRAGGAQGADEILARALRDRDKTVRSAALDALIANYGPGAARLMMPAMDDPLLAGRALESLSSSGDAEAAYSILEAGPGLAPDLKAAASNALMGMDKNAVKSAIDEHFKDNTADAALLGFAAYSVTDGGLLSMMVERLGPDDTQRLRAVLNPLITRRRPDDAGPLIDGLKSVDARLRDDILNALAGLEHGASVGALSQAMERYPGLGRDIVAVSSRTGLAADIAVVSLKSADVGIREAAADALYGLPCEKTGTILLTALKDTETAVRLAAARAAKASGCLDALLYSSKDASPEIRKAAAEGLGAHTERSSADALGRLALDPDTGVGKTALDSLVRLGETVPDDVWAGLATNARDRDMRLESLRVLVRRANPNNAPLFADALADDDKDISGAGLDGLVALGAHSLAYVYPMLDKPDTRSKALDVIETTADASSEMPLVNLLPVLEGQDLVKAVEALGMIGTEASLKPLSGAYARGDMHVKNAVLRALPGLRLKGDEPVLVDLLTRAINEPEEPLRFYAARAAGVLGVTGMKDTIKDALSKEKSSLVSSEMKKAIGML